MPNSLAVFDFDGTLTTKDSIKDFIRWHKGSLSWYMGLLYCSLKLASWKFGLYASQKAKEALLTYFYKDYPIEEFDAACRKYVLERLPLIYRKQAISKLEWHRKEGHDIVVVSASPANYICLWSKQNHIQGIATLLQVVDGKLTGKIAGKNCKGHQKLVLLKEAYDLKSYSEIYVYGDSSGDREILAIATQAFFRRF